MPLILTEPLIDKNKSVLLRCQVDLCLNIEMKSVYSRSIIFPPNVIYSKMTQGHLKASKTGSPSHTVLRTIFLFSLIIVKRQR